MRYKLNNRKNGYDLDHTLGLPTVDQLRESVIEVNGYCDESDRELQAIIDGWGAERVRLHEALSAGTATPDDVRRHFEAQGIPVDEGDGELQEIVDRFAQAEHSKQLLAALQAIAERVAAPKVSCTVNVDSTPLAAMTEQAIELGKRLHVALTAAISRKLPAPIINVNVPRIRKAVQTVLRSQDGQIVGSETRYLYEGEGDDA